MSMNINLGAKGRMQDGFEATAEGYSCYDSEGQEWIFSPNTSPTWTKGSETNVKYNWQYSYDLSTFDRQTGWTRWIRINPVMPYGNPPIGDDGDSNN